MMEYQMRKINYHKKKLNKLIQKGESLSSAKVLAQELRVDKHSLLLEQFRKTFEEIFKESIQYYKKGSR